MPPNRQIKLTARLYLADRPKLSWSVGQTIGDHHYIIFPVYSKLTTGFPSVHPEVIGAELLH